MVFPLRIRLQKKAGLALFFAVLMMAMTPVVASAQTDADTLDLPLPHGADLPGPV
jgi:hypothetical protein